MDGYDGARDGRDGYTEALKEIRRRLIRDGKVQATEQEREAMNDTSTERPAGMGR